MADQDPYGAIKFGEFRKYMQNKESKLKEQESILGNQGESGIIPVLQGLSIHVNGYTDPPQSELRRLIVQYGGDYQHYLKKSKVTHIIATTLTNSKMEEFRAYKVVTPNWITDSIQQGQLLPWTEYRVIQNQSAQRELSFGPQLTSKASSSPLQTRQTTPKAKPDPTLQKAKSLSTRTESTSKPLLPLPQLQQSISTPQPYTDISMPISPHYTTEQEQNQLPSGKELNTALLANPWNRNNSSTNPDFIKKYYQSSRLHHLSSWKAELKDIVRKAKEQQQESTRLRPISSKRNDSHRLVMHVDFDCFFASVGIKSRPELAKLPVAVSHGKGLSKNSSSDIASCNYVARSFGVRNGMHVGRAKELCPNLQIIPYEFEKYKEVSEIFYGILFQYADEIQAVSVDEALLEMGSHITVAGRNEEESLALMVRNEIRKKTGCEASIGMGANILLARLATKKAKPCNHYYCDPQDVAAFLSEQKVEDLPGVGYAMKSKFQDMGVTTVGQLRQVAKSILLSKFGPKTGQTLYDFSRGIDDRRLITKQPRQSVSAEVNWGVRFENNEQIEAFLGSLSSEISERLKAIDRKGKSITLKVLVRAKHAGEAAKHLGCGECDSHSKSVVLDFFTDDADVIAKHVKHALKSFTFLAVDIRGLSIQIQKLNNDADQNISVEDNQQRRLKFDSVHDAVTHSNQHKPESSKSKMAIDYEMYMELPQDIQRELNEEHELEFITNPQQEDRPTELHQKDQTPEPAASNENITPPPAVVTQDPSQFLPALPNWSQLDPSALLALPQNMQKQVLEAYKSSTSSKHQYIDNTTTTADTGSKPISLKPSLSGNTSANGDYGKITKSTSPRRSKPRFSKKKNLNGITLTQLFPPSPKRTTIQNVEDDEGALFLSGDGNTTGAQLMVGTTDRYTMEGNGLAPAIRDLNPSDFTLVNGTHPKSMEIWPQLPKDIQQELLQTYYQEQRQKRIQNKTVTDVQKRIPSAPIQTEPILMGKSNLADVRTLLSAWVHEFSSAPDSKDVQTVTNYLKELVWCKDLEKVQLLLMHLDRITQADSINKTTWANSVQGMKESVSHEMIIVYGAPLG
ncbi:hypothetical protein BCR42DRAFT_342701 [Absidia repens]|uniref:DNA repair protein REV1 n=1 Tax=Absidia repens TaxID=90262 RepID=A0A1X2IYL7_9FUNG|nr:hypothetical protein BCR42DRAFT_342701 [Absidia repens]